MTPQMKRLSAGEYFYCGYLLRRVENENGDMTREWDICEETTGGWVACDRFSTLRQCKIMVTNGLAKAG